MNEFIYSVKSIFSTDSHEGCLGQNNASRYYIAPYQRGYKWASNNQFDQVPQLLIDLYNAYTNKMTEYFLQYITVKRTLLNDNYVLEVIDGQQRLTTLSIFFERIKKSEFGDNIAQNKLLYSRYEKKDIFDFTNGRIEKDVLSDCDIEEQDLYYMVKAGRCIDSFLSTVKENNEASISDFIDYVLDNVKIIVNKENSFVESEEVFANLNDNKVPLTNAYLIKGLLLTKAVCRTNEYGRLHNYKDIVDQRTIMGRAWDEINSWFEQKKVSYYFFRTEVGGMEKMLELVKLRTGNQDSNDVIQRFVSELKSGDNSKSSNYELFNQYNESIKTTEDAVAVLADIKHIYRKLRGIYDNMDDCRMYNLLGYRLFSKYAVFDIREAVDLSTHELEARLKKIIIDIIPNPNTQEEELKYKSKNDKLTNLLLAYSVFPENDNKQYRFDFYQYSAVEKWSFEHISPQKPDGDIRIDISAKDWVCEAIKSNEDIIENKEILLEKIHNGEKIAASYIEFLYGGDLENVDVLGNMALLSGGVNSALSNNPFIVKRRILFEKINSGYFVPKHTIDTFSKVLNSQNGKSFTPNFAKWSKDDVDAHLEWMKARYNDMINNFKKQL